MVMSKLELMRLFDSYDGEANEGDFSPEELEEMLSAFADGDEPVSVEEFKRRYFECYDDVKDKSLKKQDW